MVSPTLRRTAILIACIMLATPLLAQQARPLTAADYARAEKMLAPNLNGLVIGGNVTPTWLPDERFWYRTSLVDGSSPTILVDPVRQTRQVCSDAIPECRRLAANAPAGGRGAPAGARGGGGGGQRGGGPVVNSSDNK